MFPATPRLKWPQLSKGNDHLVCATLWIGFSPRFASPFRCLSQAGEIVKGDHVDTRNTFYWSTAALNLPVNKDLDLDMPWD